MKKKHYKTIFKAIEANDIEAVKTFLPEHANDRLVDYNLTPLMYATIYRNKDIYRVILDAGAEANSSIIDNGSQKQNVRETILYSLWCQNWPDLIQDSVEHGLDINGNTIVTKSPFTFFICENYKSYHRYDDIFLRAKTITFLQEMIRLGANLNIIDNNRKTALDYLTDEVRAEIEAYMANLESERRSNIVHETGFDYEV